MRIGMRLKLIRAMAERVDRRRRILSGLLGGDGDTSLPAVTAPLRSLRAIRAEAVDRAQNMMATPSAK